MRSLIMQFSKCLISVVFLSLMFVQCEKDRYLLDDKGSREDGICGEVTDYDGNTYRALRLGKQVWMAENLRATHYADGSPISGWTYPDNNSDNKDTYGLLYDWWSVTRCESSWDNPSHVQGICPDGWHVPSDDEWDELIDYVGSKSQYHWGHGSDCIAKALASTHGWSVSRWGNDGTVGSDQTMNNATGFSALPAGGWPNGDFNFGYFAAFWSATEISSDHAYSRYLDYSNAGVNSFDTHELVGYSVRCVRD